MMPMQNGYLIKWNDCILNEMIVNYLFLVVMLVMIDILLF